MSQSAVPRPQLGSHSTKLIRPLYGNIHESTMEAVQSSKQLSNRIMSDHPKDAYIDVYGEDRRHLLIREAKGEMVVAKSHQRAK